MACSRPSLILTDDDKDSSWAVGIDAKGATEAMVQYGVGLNEQSGYIGETIISKSDQEPSIVALKNSIYRPPALEKQYPLDRQFMLLRVMG